MSTMPEGSRLQHALSYYRRLERVHRFVTEHLDEEIRLAEVARAAGIAPSYFSTFFHRKTGVRFHRWVIALRIARSRELLSERNYSITEIAFAVGFSSMRTFERCFRELSGTTPREFRQLTGTGAGSRMCDQESGAMLQKSGAPTGRPAP